MHSSVSEDVHGAQQARAAGPSICGSADQQQHHRRQYHHQQSGQYHTAEQGQLKALEGARAVPDEVGWHTSNSFNRQFLQRV
jgi:hypothetical protein